MGGTVDIIKISHLVETFQSTNCTYADVTADLTFGAAFGAAADAAVAIAVSCACVSPVTVVLTVTVFGVGVDGRFWANSWAGSSVGVTDGFVPYTVADGTVAVG